jgi:hypothetical protein
MPSEGSHGGNYPRGARPAVTLDRSRRSWPNHEGAMEADVLAEWPARCAETATGLAERRAGSSCAPTWGSSADSDAENGSPLAPPDDRTICRFRAAEDIVDGISSASLASFSLSRVVFVASTSDSPAGRPCPAGLNNGRRSGQAALGAVPPCPREVAIAIVHCLELAAVDHNARIHQQTHLPAEFDKARTPGVWHGRCPSGNRRPSCGRGRVGQAATSAALGRRASPPSRYSVANCSLSQYFSPARTSRSAGSPRSFRTCTSKQLIFMYAQVLEIF